MGLPQEPPLITPTGQHLDMHMPTGRGIKRQAPLHVKNFTVALYAAAVRPTSWRL